MKKSFVLSTIGTSILTNHINRKDPTEATAWGQLLRESANLKSDALSDETHTVIKTLADRALEALSEDDVQINRRMSAELNGIYGLYDNVLPKNSDDEHCLICTDTAQGQTTGTLIATFLEEQGFKVSLMTPKGLSTQDTDAFTAGTKQLIKWLEDNVPWRRESSYRVIFNLVGGFKSLQGYMNTFGAFYADEVIYIFEAETADLIKIPRLPIQIDTTVIQKHLTKFALMAAEKYYPIQELQGIPETFLERVPENGAMYAGLSAWGELLWHRTKLDLLTAELLQFPRIEYTQDLRTDFNNQRDPKARLKLQETLAEVAAILDENDGDTTKLNRGGLRFKALQGHADIYTFRVDRGTRVSCSINQNTLLLRRYGCRNTVNQNP